MVILCLFCPKKVAGFKDTQTKLTLNLVFLIGPHSSKISSSSSSSSIEDDEGDPYVAIPDANDNFEGKT